MRAWQNMAKTAKLDRESRTHDGRSRFKKKYELLIVTYRKLIVMTYLKHCQLVVFLDFVLEANLPQLPPSWFFKYPIIQLGIKTRSPVSSQPPQSLENSDVKKQTTPDLTNSALSWLKTTTHAEDSLPCTASVQC